MSQRPEFYSGQESSLKAFPLAFAKRLFAEWPEWREHARADQYGNLEVIVPCPNPDVLQPLFIGVDHEITIGLHDYHCHFENLSEDENNDEDIVDAIKYLKLLLNEEMVIGALKRDEQTILSFCRSSKDVPDRPEIAGHVGTWIDIRSWKGTHDRRIKA